VVVVCNEGYSSSLAAASLQALGLHRATDVIGGFQAWSAAGLPITRETPSEQMPDEHEGELLPDPGAAHWDRLYADRGDSDTSWYEPVPRQSLAMLDQLGIGPDQSVIDIGAGMSCLVDALLSRGHTDVTALDMSAAALQRSRQRLDPHATQATWVIADIAAWPPTRRFDVLGPRFDQDLVSTLPGSKATASPGSNVWLLNTSSASAERQCVSQRRNDRRSAGREIDPATLWLRPRSHRSGFPASPANFTDV
jgi:hypothetical protein